MVAVMTENENELLPEIPACVLPPSKLQILASFCHSSDSPYLLPVTGLLGTLAAVEH
jgi:hypothetical protein